VLKIFEATDKPNLASAPWAIVEETVELMLEVIKTKAGKWSFA
jgi:hypothetical protein